MKTNRFTAAATLPLMAFVVTTALPLIARAAEDGATQTGEAGLPPTLSEGLITGLLSLVVFVILLIVLGKFAFGPISKGLAAREAKIRNDIAEAERARLAAKAAQDQYAAQLAKAGDEVRAMLDKANADAQALATRIKMQAQTEAEEAKERAIKDIDASRRAAVAEIHEHAATLSTSIAEKILKRNLNADDQRDLVRQSLDQLGSLN